MRNGPVPSAKSSASRPVPLWDLVVVPGRRPERELEWDLARLLLALILPALPLRDDSPDIW